MTNVLRSAKSRYSLLTALLHSTPTFQEQRSAAPGSLRDSCASFLAKFAHTTASSNICWSQQHYNSAMPPDRFLPEVIARLKTYVYRLIDPRNGETFYVGKGTGDRIFAHVRGEIGDEDPSDKLRRVREIHLAGFEVAHVLHSHGMDDLTAFEVEAALMDAYAGLTNVAGRIGSTDFGVMHAEEVVRRYAAPVAEFAHRALLINVNRSATEASLYEATRYAWKVDPKKVARAEVVLPVVQGSIVGAFVAREWLEASTANFPDREPMPGRYAFEGAPAPTEMANRYIGRRIPDSFRKRGAANPVRYTWAT